MELPAVLASMAEGSITLEQEGRYVALCFIPSGLEMARLIELGVDPSDLPEHVLRDGPHYRPRGH